MSVIVTAKPSTRAQTGRFWDSALCFVLLVGGFLVLHMILRLLTSPSLYCDDSDLILFNQSFAWGYSEQPPLYSWLYWLVSIPFGANVFSLTLFRTLLLAGLCHGLYQCAFALWEDRRLARLATVSLLLVPVFVWHILTYLSHSLLMAVFCVYTFYFAIRIVQSNRLRDYIGVGFCVGLGMLSKYNFVFFVASLALAGLTLADVRKRLLSVRMLLVMAIGALIVLPHALWMWEYLPVLQTSYADKTLTDTQELWLGVVPLGCQKLVLNLFWLSLTLLFTFFLSFPIALVFVPESERDRPYMKWVVRYFLVLALLHLVYVLLTWSERLHERWLEPFFVLLPLALFGRLVGVRIPRWRQLFFVGVVSILAMVTVGARVGQMWLGGTHRGYNSISYDFRPMLPVVTTTIGEDGVVLTDHRGVGGNVCQQLPDLRCICVRQVSNPLSRAKQAEAFLIVWEAVPECPMPTHLRTYAQEHLGVSVADPLSPRFVEIPSFVSEREPHRFGYVVIHRNQTELASQNR